MSEKRASKPTTEEGMSPIENAGLLVRMRRLELPWALHPLKPKCILEALSGTNFLRYQILPLQQPRRSSSEEQLNPADNLRTILLIRAGVPEKVATEVSGHKASAIEPLHTYGLTYGVQGTAPLQDHRKLLVRMERFELSWALHPLDPKCILEAPSGTSFLPYQIVPQQQPQRSSSKEQLNPADNLRTSPHSNLSKRAAAHTLCACVDPFSDVSGSSPFSRLFTKSHQEVSIDSTHAR